MNASRAAALLLAMGLLLAPGPVRADVGSTLSQIPVLGVLYSTIAALTAGISNDPDEKAEEKVFTLPPPQAGSRLLAANYHAADTLRAYLSGRMNSDGTILVASLADLGNLENASPLGSLASSQIGSRLSQYGYRVLETRLRNRFAYKVGLGELLLTRRTAELMSAKFDAQAALVGSYQVTRDKVFVSVRVIRLEDNAVIGSHEYFLPLTGSAEYLLDLQRGDGVWEQFASRPELFASARGGEAKHARMVAPPVAPPTRVEPPARVGRKVEEAELFEGFSLVEPEELDTR